MLAMRIDLGADRRMRRRMRVWRRSNPVPERLLPCAIVSLIFLSTLLVALASWDAELRGDHAEVMADIRQNCPSSLRG
jgi:hypothetical protein